MGAILTGTQPKIVGGVRGLGGAFDSAVSIVFATRNFSDLKLIKKKKKKNEYIHRDSI
jgi:hypothetical protein